MKQMINRYLLVALALILFIPTQSFAIDGYSDVLEETSSVISLPVDGVKGQVSDIRIFGRSLKNELNYTLATYAEWAKSNAIADSIGIEITANSTWSAFSHIATTLRTSTKYGVLYNVISTNLTKPLYFGSLGYPFSTTVSKTIGNNKFSGTSASSFSINRIQFGLDIAEPVGNKIKLSNIRVFELPTGSEIESDFTNLTADQLAIKYPYIKGDSTKSTVSALRMLSHGKNHNNEQYENGRYNVNTGDEDNATNGIRGKDDIKVKPSTSYSINSNQGLNAIFVYLDKNKNVISYSNLSNQDTSTTPSSTDSIRWYIPLSENLTTFEGVEIIISEGNTIPSYEKYSHSTSYVYAEDENGNIVDLHSLPNGVKDEVSVGKLYKRVSADYAIQSGDIISLQTSPTNFDYVQILKPDDYIGYNNTNTISGNATLSVALGDKAYADDASLIGYFAVSGSTSFGYCVAKGTYSNLAEAQADLAGTTLNYQLAQPTEQNLITTPLIGYPKGTIVVEPVVKGAAMYNDGITIENTNLPIEYIESVSRIQNGVKTSVAFTKIDQYSFTAQGASNGEIYEYIYKYPSELTTIPTISYSVPINLQGQVNGNVKITEMNNQLIGEIQNKLEVLKQLLGQ